jgi:hypothetical protein
MTIEIAGVVLLMAMLGATVLARKQVDIEEEAKARQARRLALEARRDRRVCVHARAGGVPRGHGRGDAEPLSVRERRDVRPGAHRVHDPAEPDHHVPVHGADVPGRGRSR